MHALSVHVVYILSNEIYPRFISFFSLLEERVSDQTKVNRRLSEENLNLKKENERLVAEGPAKDTTPSAIPSHVSIHTYTYTQLILSHYIIISIVALVVFIIVLSFANLVLLDQNGRGAVAVSCGAAQHHCSAPFWGQHAARGHCWNVPGRAYVNFLRE